MKRPVYEDWTEDGKVEGRLSRAKGRPFYSGIEGRAWFVVG